MSILPVTIFLVGTFLSFWATSLFVRAMVERAEMRAQKSRDVFRTLDERGVIAVPTGVKTSRKRNIIVFACAPMVFLLGALVVWFSLAVTRALGERSWLGQDDPAIFLTGATLVQIAAALVTVGWWFDPSRGRRRCPKCWYDLSATKGSLCPECGRETAKESRFYRTRRKPGLFWLAAALAPCAYAVFKIPAVRATGPFALMPTTLLIATFEYWPEDLIFDNRRSSKASLSNRKLGTWEQAWLEYRAERLCSTSTNLQTLRMALALSRHRSIYQRMYSHSNGKPSLRLDESLVRKLFGMIGSDDPMERTQAKEILGYLQGFWSGWEEVATRYDRSAREMAGAAAPGLLDADTNVATTAAEIVSRSAAGGDAYVDGIVRAMRTGPANEIPSRIWTLLGLARASSLAADTFLLLTRDSDPAIRVPAINYMRVFCKTHPESIAQLRTYIEDPSDEVSVAALHALYYVDRSDEVVRDLMLQFLARGAQTEPLLWTLRAHLMARKDACGETDWIESWLAEIVTSPELFGYIRLEAARIISQEARHRKDLAPMLQQLVDERILSPATQEELQNDIDFMLAEGVESENDSHSGSAE